MLPNNQGGLGLGTEDGEDREVSKLGGVPQTPRKEPQFFKKAEEQFSS